MTEPMTIDEIRANIAATRARIVAALHHDPDVDTEAIKLLDRVFPADWGDAPLAVVWLLSNAARFATDTDGFSTAVANEWLERLVNAEGEPRERPLPDSAQILLLKWLADVDEWWRETEGNASAHDDHVAIGARWQNGQYRDRFRDALEGGDGA